MFSNMADNYVIRIATARRIGGAHKEGSRCDSKTERHEGEGGGSALYCEYMPGFSHCEFHLADSFILLGPPGWYLMEIMFQPPGIEPGTI